MKKIGLFLMMVTTLVCCDIRKKDKVVDGSATMAEMAAQDSTTEQIIDSVYNFGTITEGEKVTYNFRFKNKESFLGMGHDGGSRSLPVAGNISNAVGSPASITCAARRVPRYARGR